MLPQEEPRVEAKRKLDLTSEMIPRISEIQDDEIILQITEKAHLETMEKDEAAELKDGKEQIEVDIEVKDLLLSKN